MLVLLTSSSESALTDNDGFKMPESCCLRGLVRTARDDLSQLQILHIESDELSLGGSLPVLASQVWSEVSNPRLGLHMDVAYCCGERHIPAIDLSTKLVHLPVGVQGFSFRELVPAGWALITGGQAIINRYKKLS